jgi:hypothetical protein
MEELTFGQLLVGLNFNPSKDPRVEKVKRMCAELIDLMNDTRTPNDDYLKNVIFKHAMGEVLNAQMNVVKLLTLNN